MPMRLIRETGAVTCGNARSPQALTDQVRILTAAIAENAP